MGQPGFQKGIVVAPKISNLELLMENFVATRAFENEDFGNKNFHTNEVLMKVSTKLESIATHNKMLETQIDLPTFRATSFIVYPF